MTATIGCGEAVDDTETVQSAITIDNALSAIDRAVSDLPDYYRAMITMYHAEMLSYEEIARALDLPLGTVKSRIRLALDRLRGMLRSSQDPLSRA